MVPHTITEWESEAICLSKDNGLGIADVKRITTYQPFFLDFAVPQTVKRKELFYLSVSVFNYEETNLPVSVYMLILRLMSSCSISYINNYIYYSYNSYNIGVAYINFRLN